MKNILFKITGIAFALFLAFGINSCVKDDFDQPPVLNIPVGEQVTVSEIAALAMTSAAPIKITEDQSMFGLVTMGEQSGNFYKQVVFEDATGGIMLEFLGSTSLMVGDSIQVNLNGARVYNYNNLPQIDSLDITHNVLKISAGNTFTPEEVSIPELKTFSYTGRVVKLNNVQFISSELGETFADADALVTENKDLEDCDKNTVLVRTSGYANFAGELLPEGNGSLIAFVGRYRDDIQLNIRSYNEIMMNGERCNGGGGGGNPIEPVESVNEAFDGVADYTDVAIDGWTNILVSGDRLWQGKTFNTDKYVQASGYNSGLAEMETWLITPPVTNISTKVLSFKSGIAYWEHTTNVPLTVLRVESGEVDLSAYSGNAAIAFKYVGSDTESTSSLIDDVVITDGNGGGGGGTGGTVDMINEDFSSQTNYEDIAIAGWVNVNVEGDRKWQGKTFESETYAQATGYNSGLAAMETWLITPKITDIGSKSLSLKTAMAYWAHGSDSPLTVYVSEDYDGENYATATWVEISVPMANEGSGDHNWVDSGEVSLSNFDGDAAIAFVYVGSDTQSTSFRLDDIVVQ